MKLRLFAVVFALVLTSLATACSFLGSSGPEESATIVVLNDLDPSATMTIELRKGGGDGSTLGTVDGGTERTLQFKSREMQGTWQLQARLPSGAAVVSREFTLFAGANVRWQMRTNAVTVTQ
jgi:hypothetical protein